MTFNLRILTGCWRGARGSRGSRVSHGTPCYRGIYALKIPNVIA